MLELISFILLLIFAALIYLSHKVRRVHLMLFRILDELIRVPNEHTVNVTQQLQALELLRHELKWDRPLPITRGWAASPDYLLLLANHVAEARPRVIIECGSGTSTLILARMAQLAGRGHVFSLDHEAEFAEATHKLLRSYNLQDWATVLHAPLTTHKLKGEDWPWYDESQLPRGEIDLLVIDGPPGSLRRHSRYPAGPILLSRMSQGGTAFLDDANRSDEKDIVQWWLKENPALKSIKHFSEKGCIELKR